jgi:hypothetical protein
LAGNHVDRDECKIPKKNHDFVIQKNMDASHPRTIKVTSNRVEDGNAGNDALLISGLTHWNLMNWQRGNGLEGKLFSNTRPKGQGRTSGRFQMYVAGKKLISRGAVRAIQ